MPEKYRISKTLRFALTLTLGTIFSSCIPTNLVNGDGYMATATPLSQNVDTLFNNNIESTPITVDAALRRCKGAPNNPFIGVCEICPPKGGRCISGIMTANTKLNLTSPLLEFPVPVKTLSLEASRICLKRGVYTLRVRNAIDKGYKDKTVIIDNISCRH